MTPIKDGDVHQSVFYDLKLGKTVIFYDANRMLMEMSYFVNHTEESKITRTLVKKGRLTRDGMRVCLTLCSDGDFYGLSVLKFPHAFGDYLRRRDVSVGESECLFRHAHTPEQLVVVLELLGRLML